MNQCKTCQHWIKRTLDSDQKKFRMCMHPKCDDMGDEAELDRLIPRDGENYSAWIETGPEFGCIHHEPLQPAG